MQHDILIFRTSIRRKQDIKRIKQALSLFSGIARWNVDLEDWEKILRVESNDISAGDIIKALRSVEILASELE